MVPVALGVVFVAVPGLIGTLVSFSWRGILPFGRPPDEQLSVCRAAGPPGAVAGAGRGHVRSHYVAHP